MKLIHIIESADVDMGVYRHKLNSPQRSLLVSVARKFGEIGLKDVGRKVYLPSSGSLVWEGSHTNAPVSPKFRVDH